MKSFLDLVASGAWPFLVGGVICQVNSLNERDLNLLTRFIYYLNKIFLEGLLIINQWKCEAITGP